ncbi:hypothetical protein RQP46_004402 [Phenoliferia psychrophenolica]
MEMGSTECETSDRRRCRSHPLASQHPRQHRRTRMHQADTDSLVDASPAEVEARALEFLHDDTAPHPLSSLLHSSASTAEAEARLAALGPPIGPKDLPRKIPKSREQQEEQQGYAVAFLRKCVDEVDDSDWMFKTPPVFGAPEALDARGGDAMQNDNGDGTTWLDTAFNMESFYDEEREESVEFEEEHSGGLQFMDLGAEASSFSHTHTGTPFLLPEEEEAAGAGFSLGGRGRTGGLARGVSAMAMD